MISSIPDDDRQAHDLVTEYERMKGYVENRKPYWVFLDAERGTELSYNLFEYFPDAHYRKAIENHSTEQDDQLRPDGGRYTETHYAWFDPDTDTLLYHTEVNDEFFDPFFESETEAHEYLEQRAATDDRDRYENISLQKFRVKKVGEAIEVLTDQSGIDDFVPDGGSRPESSSEDPEGDR